METIFLAGATGFLGKPTLELLVKSNFKVYGITRKKENAELIKSLGGIPVIGDLTRIGEWIGFLKDSDIVIDLVKDSAIDNINGLEKAEQQSQFKTFVNFLVKKLNAPKPQRITQMAAKMMIGNVWVEVICKSRKVKNDKIKKWGFELKYPNYMVGIESLFNNGL